jgi:hypothetical protein
LRREVFSYEEVHGRSIAAPGYEDEEEEEDDENVDRVGVGEQRRWVESRGERDGESSEWKS